MSATLLPGGDTAGDAGGGGGGGGSGGWIGLQAPALDIAAGAIVAANGGGGGEGTRLGPEGRGEDGRPEAVAAKGGDNGARGRGCRAGDGDPFAWGFGVQTAIWGAIDVGIAVTGLFILTPSDPPKDRVVERKEQTYHDVLLFSMGLDIGYMAVGTTLVAASYYGLDNAREWRGHGTAIIIQGAALLSLETVEWVRSRRRLRRLSPIVSIGPGGAAGLGLRGTF